MSTPGSFLRALLLAALCTYLPVTGEDITVPVAPNVLPQGTKFLIRLDDTLDTAKLKQGKHFKAHTAEDVVGPNGAVLIPRGKKVVGHVSEIQQGLHGRLLLSFDEIDTGHGKLPLIATVAGVPGEHGVKSEPGPEGEIEKRGANKRRAAETAAIGAAIGATSGAAAGGGKGAGIGAGAGAAVGALAGVLTDRNLKINKGQVLEVQLDRDMRVPVR
jgi:hypothetical protein